MYSIIQWKIVHETIFFLTENFFNLFGYIFVHLVFFFFLVEVNLTINKKKN